MDDAVLCPACGEEIPLIARKCRHCGEYLDPVGPGEDAVPRALVGLGCGGVLALLLCLVGAVVAAATAPNLVRAEKARNEAAAVAALRAIAAAQERFRAEDADGDGRADYGDLGQLVEAQLLEPALVTGMHAGYLFEVAASRVDPDRRWLATARPAAPGQSGDRYFAINQAGAVYARARRAFPLDLLGCELPGDAEPLGP